MRCAGQARHRGSTDREQVLPFACILQNDAMLIFSQDLMAFEPMQIVRSVTALSSDGFCCAPHPVSRLHWDLSYSHNVLYFVVIHVAVERASTECNLQR